MILGAGAQLQLDISSVYTPVGGVVSIKGPDVDVDNIDTTVLANSSDMFRRFLAGWANGGTVEVEIKYDHLQFATLYAALRVMNLWRIVFSDNSKWDFSAYLQHISTEIPLEDVVQSPITLQLSGPPTFTS